MIKQYRISVPETRTRHAHVIPATGYDRAYQIVSQNVVVLDDMTMQMPVLEGFCLQCRKWVSVMSDGSCVQCCPRIDANIAALMQQLTYA